MPSAIIKIIHTLGFQDTASAVIAFLISLIAIMLEIFTRNLMKFLKDQKAHDDKRWQDIGTDVNQLKEELIEMKEAIKLNNESTISLIYHQCMNEAVKWKEKGFIDLGAKKYFDSMWKNYIELGDGLGTEPKDIIDSLTIKN